MASEFASAADRAQRPVTISAPTFPFRSTTGSRTRPDLVRSPPSASARKLPSWGPACRAWSRRTNS